MRKYSFFAACMLLISMVVSCSKGTAVEEVQPQMQQPDKPTATLPYINFGKPATKGLLNNDDLLFNGNIIHVYDYLQGFEGTIAGNWTSATPYINDEITYNSSVSTTIWQYVSTRLYPWTETGTHNFFGYLKKDNHNGGIDITDLVTPTVSGTTMTIPALKFDVSSPQFDLIYSDLVARDAADKIYTAVPLSFKHLFTAISIQVSNEANVPVKITDIKFNNLKNKNSASIAFADPSIVTLGTASKDGSFLPTLPSDGIILNNTEKYDVLKNQSISSGNNFYMLWPLSAAEVGEIEVEISFAYYIDDVTGWEDQPTFTKHLDELAWEAGKRNKYTLAFSDKKVRLICTVLPWDYNEYAVNFGDGTIHAPQALQFENSPETHVTVSGVEYTIHDGTALRGTFEIDAPVGGTWMIGLIGDVEYFTVEPAVGTIDPSLGLTTIRVIPKTDGAYSERYEDKKVQLTFSVNTAGRDYNADDDLNRDHCVVVLPKNH